MNQLSSQPVAEEKRDHTNTPALENYSKYVKFLIKLKTDENQKSSPTSTLATKEASPQNSAEASEKVKFQQRKIYFKTSKNFFNCKNKFGGIARTLKKIVSQVQLKNTDFELGPMLTLSDELLKESKISDDDM